MIKHKQANLNVVVDTLSRRHTLISMLETKMLGLDCIRELYVNDIDFSEPFSMCVHVAFYDYYRHDDFLFKGKRFCMPMSSIRQLFVKEAYAGDFMGHFEELKMAKSKVSPYGLFLKMAHFIPCHKSMTLWPICSLGNWIPPVKFSYNSFLIPFPYLICFFYLFCPTVLMMKVCLKPNFSKGYMIRQGYT
ncbi:hypothetical protein CR513_20931, partial [Mucuna pruriens]